MSSVICTERGFIQEGDRLNPDPKWNNKPVGQHQQLLNRNQDGGVQPTRYTNCFRRSRTDLQTQFLGQTRRVIMDYASTDDAAVVI